MVKSAAQVKKELLFWYLKNQQKTPEQVTGTEQFTIFDSIPAVEREAILRRVSLNAFELPELLTRIEALHWVLNTTEHFIRIMDDGIEKISYKAFVGHEGAFWGCATKVSAVEVKLLYDNLSRGTEPVNPKVAGAILPFGLRTSNGETIYWPMPTGTPMFNFWNVTRHCELIGRK